MTRVRPWRRRIGWWIESVLSPRLYRRCRYVTVSGATADEMHTTAGSLALLGSHLRNSITQSPSLFAHAPEPTRPRPGRLLDGRSGECGSGKFGGLQ